jgi:hypothetical protein
MTPTVIALAVVCLALLWLLRDQQKRHSQERVEADRRWADERSVLLTRIQRPEYAPIPQRDFTPVEPPRDAAALASIGTVTPLHDGEPD